MSIRIGDKILAGTYNAEDLLKSPSFSGVPTVPTASKGDTSKQIANTEYVQQALDAFTPPTVINLDNNSITKNAGGEIQTVGVIERNKGELMCDWVGTLEEYTTQNIETEHPEWTCYITDDDEFNEALVEGNNVSLLTNDMGYIGNKQITNCITEIPQDIKFELNDGTLTLKAGSKVYAPNGKNTDGSKKYFEYIFNEDVAISVGAPTGERHLFFVVNTVNTGYNPVVAINGLNLFSGNVEPTATTQTAYWFDTENNYIKRTQDTGTTWGNISETHLLTLPICIATFDAGVCKSIDQTFNGFGYIGSTVFALPGVKGLIPNGRNEDGTLNNTEVTLSSVKTFNSTITGMADFVINNTGVYSAYYNKYDEKLNKNTSGMNCVTGTYTASSGTITSLNTKPPFKAVDYFDFAPVKEQVKLKQDAATAVTYNNITNCITEIPQDIKLELNNGNIILKAGSIVYVPNGKNADGSNKFDKVHVAEDVSIDASDGTASQSDWVIFYQPNTKSARNSRTIANFSGATAPTLSTQYAVWYDTTNNVIKYTNDTGATWTTNYTSFPLCIFTRTNGTASSIDQIFNGFGYIGKTMYVLPGVSGLAPNGRDANGKIQNLPINITSVKTINIVATTQVQTNLRLSNSGIAAGLLNYNFMDNINYDGSNLPFYGINLGYLQYDGTNITQFLVKNTLQVLDYNDKSEIIGWGMPSNKADVLTLGATGTSYAAPANGYFAFFAQYQSGADAWVNIQNLNTTAAIIGMEHFWYSAKGSARLFCPAKKGDKITINYNGVLKGVYFYFIYAEGEQ